jgi:hypothetical protein
VVRHSRQPGHQAATTSPGLEPALVIHLERHGAAVGRDQHAPVASGRPVGWFRISGACCLSRCSSTHGWRLSGVRETRLHRPDRSVSSRPPCAAVTARPRQRPGPGSGPAPAAARPRQRPGPGSGPAAGSSPAPAAARPRRQPGPGGSPAPAAARPRRQPGSGGSPAAGSLRPKGPCSRIGPHWPPEHQLSARPGRSRHPASRSGATSMAHCCRYNSIRTPTMRLANRSAGPGTRRQETRLHRARRSVPSPATPRRSVPSPAALRRQKPRRSCLRPGAPATRCGRCGLSALQFSRTTKYCSSRGVEGSAL